jgi:dTDP-glucose 4,6-dehydratase
MKKILITGAAGFAGHHFMQHIILNTDWFIIAVDALKPPGDIERINEIGADWQDRYTFIEADIADPKFVELAEENQVDYIVNFASESHVQRSIEDPKPFIKNNIDLMVNILEYARIVKPEVFIQISTDEVYGAAPEGINFKEWAATLPSNPYSASKAAQESLAISYWRTYGIPLVITNCMNMFGERQDIEKFIPMLISDMLQDKKVVIHGTPEYIGSRYYLHARNQADALLYILENLPPVKYVDGQGVIKPSKYNVEGDIELNNLEVAKLIAGYLDKELDYELFDAHATRPGHDRRYALDGQRLRSLGWNPPVDFYGSLKKTVQWTKENRRWIK